MNNTNAKDLIIREGMEATLHYENKDIPITITNVTKDSTGIYFNAVDFNYYLIKDKNGKIMKWSAFHAIKSKTIVLKNPIYANKNEDKNTIKVDLLESKRNILKDYYLHHVKLKDEKFVLDDDQLNAILSDTNTLVTARAGSGKTRVLVAKLVYLFEKQNLNENNVLAFCFNKDASVEISNRLNNQCKIDDKLKYLNYNIARTFHPFSKNAVAQHSNILEDRNNLIKLIINEIRNNDYGFSQQVYQFFKNETLRIDRKNFHNISDYYKYIKNCEYTTLNNEKVKSKYEKYIADYLFEHGIEYIYEKSFFPYKISLHNSYLSNEDIKTYAKLLEEKKETIPDFYLPEYNTIWEHWAIDGNESKEEIEQFEKQVGSYNDYVLNKEWKKKFWNPYWRKKLSNNNRYNCEVKSITDFIESDCKSIDGIDRAEIENKIEELLCKHNIIAKKLPEEVIIEKVWEKAIDGFTLLINQFINKLQQNYFDDINVFIEKAKKIEDERTKTYYRLGYIVYKKYLEIITNNSNESPFKDYNYFDIDFNQLIYECSKAIRNGELDEQIKELKWILIDEYQDFSRLFDYLIESIMSRNPDIKLFCVGDDWQAINRFAGSDLHYFNTFVNKYKNTNFVNIKTNYRSEGHIVNFANSFANKFNFIGERQKASKNSFGESKEIDVSDVYIGKFDDENIYIKYFQEKEHKKIEKAKYMKTCSDIIKKYPDKKIMLLNRSNSFFGRNLDDIYMILKRICCDFMSNEDFLKNVQLKTVHKAKGEEADIVILLNINEGVFPVYNQNDNLFEIFGQQNLDSVKDEEKLYYVALTRAKECEYILYEEKCKSPFILYSTTKKSII